MEKILDYSILDKIESDRSSSIFRAKKDNDSDAVVIRHLKLNNTLPTDIARFKQEYEAIRQCNVHGMIKIIDVVDHQDSLLLIQEDFDGVSIKKNIQKEKPGIIRLLEIGINISKILGNLHQKEIVHKDIRPQNVFIKNHNCDVKLTGFAISPLLTRENKEIYHNDVINNILPYMSPEQTGRMNRMVDYRTDLYSLGITLYEMLTGILPFRSKDPLEIIHCHLAREPELPTLFDPDIPDTLSNIILKLLSKSPEERYQNAFGLKADLSECKSQLLAKKRINDFELAQYDLSNKFNIPQKLYGREDEIQKLISSFEKVTQGITGMMLVTGHPGIGKSALIGEIHKPVVARRGYFISGKYDQLMRDVPYSAVIQAFSELIRQILSESEEKINRWKDYLLSALGVNGKTIIDIIPEVKFIIGKQPEIMKLGPEESKNRFLFIFEQFVQVFAQKKHPVVLFLDDLQWADSASLYLIKKLATSPNIKYLFIIGAYRHTESEANLLFLETIDQIEKQGVDIGRISLLPIEENDITNLIRDFFKCSKEKSTILGEVILKKTGGNPFFVNQFLRTLFEIKHISPSQTEGWTWKIDPINQMQVTENVVDFLADKIDELPEPVKLVLKICSCIGNHFDLETLSHLLGKSVEDTLYDLTPAINQRHISLAGDQYAFHHDRIQEAAYSLIPEDKKKELHFNIGKLSLDKIIDDDDLQNRLFYIVDHLNQALELLEVKAMQEELVTLNLRAGQKAKDAAAFIPAFKYLQTGINLLEKECWRDQYDLTLSIYIESVETAYMNGDLKEMDQLADIAISNTKSALDKVKFYQILISAGFSQKDFNKSLAYGHSILRQLDFPLPENPSKLTVLFELIKMKTALMGKSIEELENLPKMVDPKFHAIEKILRSMSRVARFSNMNLSSIVIFKMLSLNLKHGMGLSFTAGLAVYGGILMTGLGDFKGGFKYAELAMRLVKKPFFNEDRYMITYFNNAFIRHWKTPSNVIAKSLLETVQAAQEIGGLFYIALIYLSYSGFLMICNVNYKDASKEIKNLRKLAEHSHQQMLLLLHSMAGQYFINMTGESDDPTMLDGDMFNEQRDCPTIYSGNDAFGIGLYYQFKTILYYFFHHYDLAMEYTSKWETHYEVIKGTITFRYFIFFDSLVRLSSFYYLSKKEKKISKKKILKNVAIIKKWAKLFPENFLGQFYLIKAEVARLERDYPLAERMYDQAMDFHKENKMDFYEEISIERAAIFYLEMGKMRIASSYLTDALLSYKRRGMDAKVTHLQEKFPNLLHTFTKSQKSVSPIENIGPRSSETFDLSTVIKASQIISSEIVLEKLLAKITKIAIENAGAQRGFLIRRSEDQACIVASANIGTEEVIMQNTVLSTKSNDLCSSVVNYVMRTGDDIVLHDAVKEGGYTQDRYIIANNVKSILCAPFQYKKQISGIFYLENNLVSHAFTKDRIELLQVILSQAAISLENAELFKHNEIAREELAKHRDHLEELVKERTKKLEAAQKELVENAHQAGMADVATDILHNVGNTLNSVKVSAETIRDITRNTKYSGIQKANSLIRENLENINEFMIHNPKGKKVLEYYLNLEDFIMDEKKIVTEQITRLIDKVGTIEAVVEAQQNYAQTALFNEKYALDEVVNDTLTMQSETLTPEGIHIIKEYQDVPKITIQKRKLMHIIVNLIENAKQAMQEYSAPEKKLSISINKDNTAAYIKVKDTGKGISKDKLETIFMHGFSTKKDGRGFGLHSSANYMTEMNGTMWAESAGEGNGATFVLKFPFKEE